MCAKGCLDFSNRIVWIADPTTHLSAYSFKYLLAVAGAGNEDPACTACHIPPASVAMAGNPNNVSLVIGSQANTAGIAGSAPRSIKSGSPPCAIGSVEQKHLRPSASAASRSAHFIRSPASALCTNSLGGCTSIAGVEYDPTPFCDSSRADGGGHTAPAVGLCNGYHGADFVDFS
jgi:hypothetical protein